MQVRMCSIFMLPLAIVPGATFAQTHRRLCTEESVRPSFFLTDRNRLANKQILSRVFGRTFAFRRVDRDASRNLRYTIYLREDGSSLTKCEAQHGPGSSWGPCRITGDPGTGRIVGAWRIEGHLLCGKTMLTSTTPGGCFSVHEDSGRIALKQVSGDPACLEGDWEPQ